MGGPAKIRAVFAVESASPARLEPAGIPKRGARRFSAGVWTDALENSILGRSRATVSRLGH